INEKGGRQSTHSVTLGDFATLIQENRQMHTYLLQEGPDHGWIFLEIDGEQREGLPLQLLRQTLQLWHLRSTGYAPGRPEIEEHHSAALLAEELDTAVQKGQVQLRRWCADSRNRRRRIR